jgi:hypothetical protein
MEWLTKLFYWSFCQSFYWYKSHVIVWFSIFESHYNSLNKYWGNFSINIFTDIIVGLIPSVTSSVKVTCHFNFCLFYSLFSRYNSIGIYQRNFSIGVYQWIHGRKILSVKFITIYWWKNLIFVSVSICQLFGSVWVLSINMISYSSSFFFHYLGLFIIILISLGTCKFYIIFDVISD